MIENIYVSIWLVDLMAFAACHWIGFLTATVLVVFGFIGFRLIFMGMIGLFPELGD